MKNLIKTEFFKLSKSKMFWGIIIWFAIIVPLMMMNIESEEIMYGKDAVKGLFNGFVGQILLMTTFIFASTLTNEFKSGYIIDSVSFGYKRKSIYRSKWITFSIANAILNMLASLAMPISMSIRYGYGEEISVMVILKLAETLLLIGFISMFFSSVICAMAFIVKKLYILLIWFGLIFNISQGLFVLLLNENFIKYKNFHINNQIDNFLSPDRTIKQLILMIILVSIGSLVSNYIGFLVFSKSEVK